MPEVVGVCSCGAISVEVNDQEYFMSKETFEMKFPDLEIPADKNNYGNCNHCVNHWGIDLCACGSGEAPDECEEGFDECGNPMQSIEGGYTSISGGWL